MTTDSQPSEQTTEHHIKNPSILFIGRSFFILIFILSMISIVGLLQPGLDYYRAVAEQSQIDISPDLYAAFNMSMRLLATLVSILIGVFLFWQRSNDRIGLLTAVFLVAFGTGGISAYFNHITDRAAIVDSTLIRTSYLIVSATGWSFLSIFVAIFPDGRIAPRWVIVPSLFGIILTIIWGVIPSTDPNHPLNYSPLLNFLVIGSLSIGYISAQVYRYRFESTKVQRQQTRWFLSSFAIVSFIQIIANALKPFSSNEGDSLISYLLVSLADSSYIVGPIALLIAVLRYRLWDVDWVINRSLLYGALTSIAVFFFFVDMLIVQVVIGEQQPMIALIIALATSVLIYKPIKKRVQHFIDRKVYKLRFDLNELQAAQKSPEVKTPGLLTGKDFGGYKLLDVIGRGGMGEVYKGINEAGEVAAIKVLPAELAEEAEFLRRFAREAEMLKVLSHPNIVKIHTVGEIYIAMEYIDGQELKHYIKNQDTPNMNFICSVVNDIADALDYIHSQGLVHRDIKPSNIMIRSNGEAVLMDFGIAKVQNAAHTRFTGTGAIGTIDYMAPEQIVEAREVDHRADIYALGIVLYEMLTGERPFKGNAAQVMFAHLQQPPPDPRDLLPDLPRHVARAVQKTLQKTGEERYQHAGELVRVLECAAV